MLKSSGVSYRSLSTGLFDPIFLMAFSPALDVTLRPIWLRCT